MSGVQTWSSAALEAEQAEVGDLLTGGHELLEDDVTEDLMGADTASDNDMEASYHQTHQTMLQQRVMQEQERGAGQLTEDAGLIMHILSQGFQTAETVHWTEVWRMCRNTWRQIRER